uniref:Putative terminase n=1 Tax=viral metagenome TaxID=1070528 RepID=A0A6H1ZBX4_9ZZZZ
MSQKNPKLNEKELADKLEKLILDNLFYFDRERLGYDCRKSAHWDMCRFIDGTYSDHPDIMGRKFKLILMPRNTYKTSLVTIGKPINFLIKNPNGRVLIGNELFDNAKRYLGEIKGHFEQNEKLRTCYGDFVGSEWTKEQITVKARTANLKEPSIDTCGIGVVKVGMHYDLIILDDMHSQANTRSRGMINEVIEFYKLALSLLDPNGEMIVIGTRWTYYDLYNHIIENEKHRFDYIVRQAINSDGQLLFPEVLSREFLADVRLSQGSFLYSGQYQNDPIDDETAEFKKEDIRYFEIDKFEKYVPVDEPDSHRGPNPKNYGANQMNWYMHLDPSKGVKHGDLSGLIISAVDPKGRIFVPYAEGFNLRKNELIDKMIWLLRKNRYITKLLIETRGFQEYIADDIYTRCRKENIPLQIMEMLSSDRKDDRILGLQPIFARGDIYLARGLLELEDEILRFGSSKYDDLFDALSFGVKHWKEPTSEYANSEGAKEGTVDWWRQTGRDANPDKYKDVIGNNVALQRIGINA